MMPEYGLDLYTRKNTTNCYFEYIWPFIISNDYYNSYCQLALKSAPQRSPQWLKDRINGILSRNHVGASKVRYLVGGASIGRIFEYEFASKLNEKSALYCAIGNLFEEVLCAIYTLATKTKIQDACSIKSDYYAASCTPDGFAYTKDNKFITLECKAYPGRNIDKLEKMPLEHRPQVNAQMDITGCDEAHYIGSKIILCSCSNLQKKNNSLWVSFMNPFGLNYDTKIDGYGYIVIFKRKALLCNKYCKDCDCQLYSNPHGIPRILNGYSIGEATTILNLVKDDSWVSRHKFWNTWSEDIYNELVLEKGEYIIPFITRGTIFDGISQNNRDYVVSNYSDCMRVTSTIIDQTRSIIGRNKNIIFNKQFISYLVGIYKNNIIFDNEKMQVEEDKLYKYIDKPM